VVSPIRFHPRTKGSRIAYDARKMADHERLPDMGVRPVRSLEGLSTLADEGTYVPRGARTSDSDPFEVAWIDAGVHGRLGIAMAPGRHDKVVGAFWWRDLHVDLRRLRHVHRVHLLVTLLTDDELLDLGIANLTEAARVHDLESLRLPIRDGSVPTPQQEDAVIALVRTIVQPPPRRRDVVIHCRAGQGRSGHLGGPDAGGARRATCRSHRAGSAGPAARRRDRQPGGLRRRRPPRPGHGDGWANAER
jgi:hypothetical protein